VRVAACSDADADADADSDADGRLAAPVFLDENVGSSVTGAMAQVTVVPALREVPEPLVWACGSYGRAGRVPTGNAASDDDARTSPSVPIRTAAATEPALAVSGRVTRPIERPPASLATAWPGAGFATVWNGKTVEFGALPDLAQ
jgi:hypothetical protein